ncbi:MAG TPA: redox-regulated ATPase YchF [Anaerolineae bacterium]|nr:redox-regulated ATPase YchF [Anaerolineae bacterium]MCB0179447.1 redox-regulated ATPase YchF [Anaerolineae bacterium]MCB0222326.1 redox-regulated ATPase YchF [Anaerolineae bacterium]MCB9106777.1 redox-regulated ATPase YchF [Anaerolineales bacterium]HRV90775.1 redox-regulated ATPase YchF [Anaerolineae bacterium]
MRIGIIGLPNCGKTTIFNVLTGGKAPTAAYTGGTFQVNTAVVPVPDPRVDALSQMYNPQKTTYARVEYADIAGLSGSTDDQTKGVGLSGELMNAIANNDALLHVVRVFEDETVPHSLGSVNPARDIASLDSELSLSDLSKIENRLERLEVSLKKGKAIPTFEDDQKEYEILSRLKPHVEQGQPIRDFELTPDEEKRLRGFQFLSAKPVLIIFNLGDEAEPPNIDYPHQKSKTTAIRGRLEMDIAQLEDEDDRTMFMEEYNLTELSTARIIRESYDLLGRMVFFTTGEDEVRAWEVTQNAPAIECAGAIHSDLARGFIRAEVTSYDDLMAAGSNAAAKAAGKVRLEGKDHIVHDGDIIVVRFNVQK